MERIGLIKRANESESERDATWLSTRALEDIQQTLELSLGELEHATRRPHLAEVSRLQEIHEALKRDFPGTSYRTDMLASVAELAACVSERCYIAVMALSGKILEICLKHQLDRSGCPFDDSWMLGTLLKKLKESGDTYLDPSLTNVSNIINQSRIPAVHAKRDVPVPSKDQAVMVIRATCDVIERTLLVKTAG